MRIGALIVAGLLAAGASEGAPHLAGRKPNIIFILTDDQGYGDLSCHANPVLKTPNLDRLHDEGVRFTDFHVSPTCAPTRSALMTGRHESRNGVTHTILERERLTLKAITLAQVLQSAGYTTGIFGKWHLGDEPDHWPRRRGFDEMFIHAYDRWWSSVQPQLVNERAVGPKMNPFKELYWKQFGGGPDAALLREMDPTR